MIPGSRRSPGEENGNPLQYSYLENSMDYTVHGITKSRTRLNDTHKFFIHSSTDGHSGGFQVLTVVHSAAVNVGMHVSFRIIVLS